MTRIFLFFTTMLLASCSGEAVDHDNALEAQTAAILDTSECPSSSIESVSMERQEPMVNRCNSLHTSLRNSNIIAHGGVRPGVEADIWNGLSEFEQAKVLLSAACQQSAGIPGPQAVTVVEAGTSTSLVSKTVCVRDPLQLTH